MTDSGYFYTVGIGKSGRMKWVRYAGPVDSADIAFIDRATEVLPRLVDAPTERIQLPPRNGWFTP